jgi:hypothetical protein
VASTVSPTLLVRYVDAPELMPPTTAATTSTTATVLKDDDSAWPLTRSTSSPKT